MDMTESLQMVMSTTSVRSLDGRFHAQAGADFVAPSDMMDGRVCAFCVKG
jgi:delta-aminolevulinic acid dehydratase/porphobilinogen synthase